MNNMGLFKNLFKKLDKNTVESNTPKKDKWMTLKEDTPIVLKSSKEIESFVNAVEKGSQIAKLEKIKVRTKKQRTMNKLQKRIDTYGRDSITRN